MEASEASNGPSMEGCKKKKKKKKKSAPVSSQPEHDKLAAAQWAALGVSANDGMCSV